MTKTDHISKRRVGRSETAPYRWKMVGLHFVPFEAKVFFLVPFEAKVFLKKKL
jgi:hypothetical protein